LGKKISLMSDVLAVEKLVEKHAQLKKEISKIIIGQEAVIDQIYSVYTRFNA